MNDGPAVAGKPLMRQVSVFAVVGAVATAVYLVVANLLMYFTEMPAEWSSVLAYLAGMVVSFAGQSRLTFGVRNVERHHLIRFLIVSGAGLLVSYFSVIVVTDVLHAHAAWATLVTVAVVPVASFIAMKLWVFATRA